MLGHQFKSSSGCSCWKPPVSSLEAALAHRRCWQTSPGCAAQRGADKAWPWQAWAHGWSGLLLPGLKPPGQAGAAYLCEAAVCGRAVPPEPAQGVVVLGQLSCLQECRLEPGPLVDVGWAAMFVLQNKRNLDAWFSLRARAPCQSGGDALGEAGVQDTAPLSLWLRVTCLRCHLHPHPFHPKSRAGDDNGCLSVGGCGWTFEWPRWGGSVRKVLSCVKFIGLGPK